MEAMPPEEALDIRDERGENGAFLD